MAPDRLQIEFDLSGLGWMDIRLSRGSWYRQLDGLSYLTPVLDDVVAMALSSMEGTTSSFATFELEPGQLRLSCETRKARTVLRATEADNFTRKRLPARKPAWEIAFYAPGEFGRAVLAGANMLEKQLGHEGYAQLWSRDPFPAMALGKLKKALEGA